MLGLVLRRAGTLKAARTCHWNMVIHIARIDIMIQVQEVTKKLMFKGKKEVHYYYIRPSSLHQNSSI